MAGLFAELDVEVVDLLKVDIEGAEIADRHRGRRDLAAMLSNDH